MADYVEYGSLATVAGPLRSEGSHQWVFVLEADHEKLSSLCRRCFAEPSGGELDIRPLGHHVMLSIGRIDRVVSLLPPFDRMGWAPEGQSAVWVPVARVRGDVVEELMMFTPYMWVDNPLSLPSGREMYGYPKAWGWIDVQAPGAYSLDVLGMDYDRGEEAKRRPLVRIETVEERSHGGGIWSELADVAHHLRGILDLRPGLELLGTLLDDIRGGGLRQVFLHQIRAAQDGSLAALQQIAAARYRVLKMSGGPLGHEYSVRIEALDSHPLAEELGLRGQVTRYAFHTATDFELGVGEVLWPAGDPAQHLRPAR